MSPKVIILGAMIFSACMIAHILIWRYARPKNEIAWLGIIFFISPILVLAGFYVFAMKTGIGLIVIAAITFTGWVTIFLLHYALSLFYIFNYPAAQAVSPSLKMLLILRASDKGCTLEEISGEFSENVLFEERLKDLLRESLIAETPLGLEITPSGRAVITFFVCMRRILGLPIGEG